MPPFIPAEIWLNVAQFIPKEDLLGMFGINCTFFQLAMDEKYREATVSVVSEAAFKKRFKLVAIITSSPLYVHNNLHFREPQTGRRVRKLRVSLAPYEYTHWTKADIRSLTATITNLTNIRELFVELPWPPGDDLTPFLPFLTTAWTTFGSSLYQLHILGPLKSFPSLIPIIHNLTALQSLCVDLNELAGGPNIAQRRMLAKELALLINKLSPTLRHLSLRSQFGYDNLPLFSDLESIPNLERVEVNVYCSLVFSSQGLIGFLRRHSTKLRHLEWNGRFLTESDLMGEFNLNYGDESEQCVIKWLRNFGLDKIFSGLLVLRLPIPSDDCCFSLMVRCIKYSVDSLTSLDLYDSYLSVKQVETIVSMFALCQTRHLREFHFYAEFLSPELILIVHMLPYLAKLGIKFEFLRTQNLAMNSYPINEEERKLVMHDFADSMRKTHISDWLLRDIKITSTGNLFPEEEAELMMVLAEQIPSVKRIDGIDKECYTHAAL